MLTLFMLNTLAENARKFTPTNGYVSIYADEKPDYVEISVKDTGIGIDAETKNHIFDRKTIIDNKNEKSHGFGLMNCNGIINKYKKLSKLFTVCMIGVESESGKGSKFYFRLPKGIIRVLFFNFPCLQPPYSHIAKNMRTIINISPNGQNTSLQELDMANRYADSAYFSNIKRNLQAYTRFFRYLPILPK